MSHNTFGHLFRVTTWGESHGPSIGCVIDGCPPGIPLTAEDIQAFVDKRRPGQSRFTTQRREPDTVRLLSGIFVDEAGRQVTTGTPISLVIDNVDQRGRDYDEIKDKFRPGHADLTYWAKYGIRDYRGGGRSSARETAMRVAAGAIARKILPGVTVRGPWFKSARIASIAADGPGRKLTAIPSSRQTPASSRPGRATSTRCARQALRSEP